MVLVFVILLMGYSPLIIRICVREWRRKYGKPKPRDYIEVSLRGSESYNKWLENLDRKNEEAVKKYLEENEK